MVADQGSDNASGTESHDDARPTRRRFLVLALLVLLVASVGVGVFIFLNGQGGGPIDGDAADRNAFIDSFPDDWDCEPSAENPAVNLARVVCDEPPVQYLWFADSSQLDKQMSRPGFAPQDTDPGCTIKSGSTIAAVDSTLSPTGSTSLDEGEANQFLIDSFSGDAETIGTDCP